MTKRSMMLPAAAFSVLLTMMSVSQVFQRQRWFVPSVFAVLLAFGAGWVARRLDVPAPLAPAVSLLVLLAWLGVVFLRDTTAFGLPTPDTMRALGESLSAAGADIRTSAPPAEATTALTLLATAGVFLVAMVVDIVVFWARRPVAAGLPLLALFLVPTSMADKANVFAFVLAAGGYLGLLVAEGRDRARGWGRRLSGMELVDDHADVSHVARVGRRIGSAAVGIALCVPLAVPSVGKGIFDGDGRGFLGHGKGSRTVSVINPIVQIKARLQDETIHELLTVHTTTPEYLRMTSLDEFNGDEWKLVEHQIGADKRVGKNKQIDLPDELDDVNKATQTYQIAIGDLAVNWLPIPYAASRVTVQGGGDWRYDKFNNSVFAPSVTSRRVTFVAESQVPQPTVEQLRATGEIPKAIRDKYLAVPKGTPRIARDVLAEETAGKTNPYDKAVALNDYFFNPQNGHFVYDLTVTQANNTDALTSFLENKHGYCEQFAATMAYLSRLAGIPARVVVGFTPGAPINGDVYVVTNKDAHAWPELYFPATGWVKFEPTPRGDTVPPSYARLPGAPVPVPSNDPGATKAPSAAPSASASRRPNGLPDPDTDATDPLAGQANKDNGGVPVLPLAFALAAVMLAAPTVVGAVTRRRRRTRAVDHVARIHAAWEALADAAEDAGHPLRAADSPRGSARRLVAGAALTGAAADEVLRLATAEERARYARSVAPADGLEAGVRSVRRALLAGLPNVARARATVFPASSVRRILDAFRSAADAVDRLRARVRTTLWGLVRRRPRAA
jgi:transglutaminase-like putative cysteine protease